MTQCRRSSWFQSSLLVLAVICTLPVMQARALDFPGADPGPARCRSDPGRLTLENAVLALQWNAIQDRLRPDSMTDKLSGKVLSLAGTECFQIVLDDSPDPRPRRLKASDLRFVGQPQVEPVTPDRGSPRSAEHLGGRQVRVRLVSADGRVEVEWRAVLRDGSNYVQCRLALKAVREPLEVKEVVCWDMAVPSARVMGSVDGVPVATDTLFFGCEHPMARSEVSAAPAAGQGNRCRCWLPYNSLVRPDHSLCSTAILGVAPAGQLRRGFLYYLERERAHPYRPFLHYNNGSEIGCEYWRRQLQKQTQQAQQFRLGQEQVWLKNIQAFGEELVAQRGVTMSSFVHDFEWDDEKLVWQFHEGYPHGFTPAQEATRKYGAAVGVWLSPSGGYPCKPARMEQGRRLGFETNPNGLSLAGPRYYARLRQVCANMVLRYGVNYFKFDGFGAGNNQSGAGPYASDVEALLQLMTELRGLQPDVFFNPSTGTWPSPFWLKYADSIWRQGSDTSVAGKGSDRQRWITYRDSEIYHGVLERSPLYPLNSLMIHGIYINALPLFGNPYDPAAPRPSYDPADIAAEVRSFFGTGTNLQELYIEPKLMTPPTWDALAEAARWSRAHADVLVDTHWLGGDPARGQVYGWASWTTRKGILVLRNPDEKPAEMALDLGRAFELPRQAALNFTLNSPWKETRNSTPLRLMTGRAHTFTLKPFEVLVLEATPAGP